MLADYLNSGVLADSNEEQLLPVFELGELLLHWIRLGRVGSGYIYTRRIGQGLLV
jgi:hypothetical protein